MTSEDYDEIQESVSNIADYYSDISGKFISAGVSGDDDIWVSSSRTNGREYFDSVQELERRLEIIYADYLIDNNQPDNLEY